MADDFEEFRSTVTIKRKSGGSYVNGHWVAGTETTITILADIQSWKQEELQLLPEARRLNQTSKMFTDVPLQSIDDENPDIVLVDGVRYEVLANYPFQHNLINHYKVELQKCEQGL